MCLNLTSRQSGLLTHAMIKQPSASLIKPDSASQWLSIVTHLMLSILHNGWTWSSNLRNLILIPKPIKISLVNSLWKAKFCKSNARDTLIFRIILHFLLAGDGCNSSCALDVWYYGWRKGCMGAHCMSRSLVFSSSRKSFNNQKTCGLSLMFDVWVWCLMFDAWCWYSRHDWWLLGPPCPRRCLASSPSLFTGPPGAPEYSLYKINAGPDREWFSSALAQLTVITRELLNSFTKTTRRTESKLGSLRSNWK